MSRVLRRKVIPACSGVLLIALGLAVSSLNVGNHDRFHESEPRPSEVSDEVFVENEIEPVGAPNFAMGTASSDAVQNDAELVGASPPETDIARSEDDHDGPDLTERERRRLSARWGDPGLCEPEGQQDVGKHRKDLLSRFLWAGNTGCDIDDGAHVAPTVVRLACGALKDAPRTIEALAGLDAPAPTGGSHGRSCSMRLPRERPRKGIDGGVRRSWDRALR